MSSFDEHVKDTKSSTVPQRTRHYHLKPKFHPHGWKLEIKEGKGPIVLEVDRLPTTVPHYKLHSHKSPKMIPLKIKSTTIEDVIRYTLFEGNQEQMSIQWAFNSSVVLLRNQQRKTIARFLPITTEIVLLRTPTGSVARLRFKEKPAPVHYQIECEAQIGLQWLYAIVLYSIARIERIEIPPLPKDKVNQEEEKPPART